jgi:hypothetical protein
LTPPLFAKSDRLQTIKLRLSEIEKALQPDQDKREASETAAEALGHEGEKLLTTAIHASVSSVPREGQLEEKIARIQRDHENWNKRAAGRGR